jgi:hypothetical protein
MPEGIAAPVVVPEGSWATTAAARTARATTCLENMVESFKRVVEKG